MINLYILLRQMETILKSNPKDNSQLWLYRELVWRKKTPIDKSFISWERLPQMCSEEHLFP